MIDFLRFYRPTFDFSEIKRGSTLTEAYFSEISFCESRLEGVFDHTTFACTLSSLDRELMVVDKKGRKFADSPKGDLIGNVSPSPIKTSLNGM